MGQVISKRKITAEEAEAFRARVRERNEKIATEWVVVDIDDVVEVIEGVLDVQSA